MSDQDVESDDCAKSPSGENESPSDNKPECKGSVDDTAAEEMEEEQMEEVDAGTVEGSEDSSDEDEDDEEKKEKQKPKKKQNLIKKVMEYDVSEMYPEMSVLTDKNKREWDYQDPETIRAIWLESKTNALAEWKIKYLTIKKSRKPQIEVRDTTTYTLRMEYLKTKEENQKAAETKDLLMIEKGRESPKFDEVKLPTNTTTDMRYKYNRNNPPVPHYYVEHFDKHKKPPFKIHGTASLGCKPL